MPADDIIRIEIAKRWTASEFSELMSQLQFLYDTAQFAEVVNEPGSKVPFWFQNRARRPVSYYHRYFDPGLPFEEEGPIIRLVIHEFVRDYGRSQEKYLQITRIKYNSPGFVDVAGVGKVVEEVRKFLTDIMDRYLHRHDRKLARESAEQDVLAKKIKNAFGIWKLGEKTGIDPQTCRVMIAEALKADYFVEGKVLSGQITRIGGPEDTDGT